MRSLKYFFFLTVLVAFFVTPVLAQAPSKTPQSTWFDMEHCEMCKPLMAQPGLMQNMTWEQHAIADGIISVTTVREPFMKQYKDAQMQMADVAKRLQAGEKVQLCPSCTEFGTCIMKGAKIQNVPTMHGDIVIATSDNPELVAELQAWATRCNDEMAKMNEMKKADKGEKEKK
jgi:hypothetical protein